MRMHRANASNPQASAQRTHNNHNCSDRADIVLFIAEILCDSGLREFRDADDDEDVVAAADFIR